MNIQEIEEKYVAPTYGRRGLIIEKGEGVYLYDDTGKKYIDCFSNVGVNILGHNVKELNQLNNSEKEIFAEKHLKAIKNEYKTKLKSHDNNLTEEHEMLIDFVTLTLSLLVKTPPNLRERIIEETTDNEMIKKILLSKLPSIEKHYIPVSLLEIAISKEER